jgi:hypothetical protein
MKFSILPLAITLLLIPLRLHADVQSAAEQNMTVQITLTVKGTPEAAWENLLKVGTWWSSDHTWSGDSKNLTLNAVPGGGFDESLPGSGFVRHMQVIYSDPGKKLRMTGVLGPLQEHALQGTMTISLKAEGDTTIISTTYHVAGHFPGGLEKLAPLVDQVITEQFTRLGKQIDGTL